MELILYKIDYIFQRNQSIFIVLLAIKAIASVANTVTLGLIFLCLKILNSSAVKFLDKIAIAAFL
jgi:hypothetical protein